MILLVGLMGSGKSILGKHIASRLSLQLIDLDDYIVAEAEKTIPEIFEGEGEGAFRSMESEALSKVLQTDKESIIATGGGAILSSKNRALMKENGTVIWLGASPEILAARITGDSNRPLLTDVDPLAKMIALSLERNPFYEEVADLYVDTGKLSDEEAVAKILDFLSE